jgi:hypothetical protein
MKYIKQYEFVINNTELKKIVNELNIAPLYHSLKEDRAIKSLKENKLGGYSMQRYWKGGKRYKDDHPEYEKSIWMRGISTSRDIEYCAKWNNIIFVFDQSKLKTKYKVVPYNWGFSIGNGYKQGSRMKREREEFIITGFSDINDIEYKDKYLDEKEISDIKFKKMIEETNGYIVPLDKYLLGFFISSRFEEFINKEDRNFFESHKKYLGIYNEHKTK